MRRQVAGARLDGIPHGNRYPGCVAKWPRARLDGIPQGNHWLSFREGLEDSVVTRDVQLELRPKGSGCQSDQRVQCLSRGAGKDLHSVGRHPSLPFQPMQYFHPCVRNFRGSTLVDLDPTHSWKPEAFQEIGIRIWKENAAEVNSAIRVEGTRLT